MLQAPQSLQRFSLPRGLRTFSTTIRPAFGSAALAIAGRPVPVQRREASVLDTLERRFEHDGDTQPSPPPPPRTSRSLEASTSRLSDLTARQRPLSPRPQGVILTPQSIFGKFSKILKHGDYERAHCFLHLQLSRRLLRNHPGRLDFYIAAIDALLSSGRFYYAVATLSRMQGEGFITSARLCTSFLSRAFASRGAGLDDLLSILRILDESVIRVDEHLFATCLRKLASCEGITPSILEDVMQNYINLQTSADRAWIPSDSLFSLMISKLSKAGDLSAAQRWFDKYRHGRQACERRDSRVYVAMMAAYLNADAVSLVGVPPRTQKPSSFQELVRNLLDAMASDGASPTVGIYNMLISHHARSAHPERALDVYRLLRKASPSLWPDTFTFASTFHAHEVYRAPRRRRGGFIEAVNSPWPKPRRLFREMMEVHGWRTRGRREKYHQRRVGVSTYPGVLTPSLMSTVLRVFLQKQDYSGAIVVLRTCFSTFLNAAPRSARAFAFRRGFDERIRFKLSAAVVRSIWRRVRGELSLGESHQPLEDVGYAPRAPAVYPRRTRADSDAFGYTGSVVESSADAPVRSGWYKRTRVGGGELIWTERLLAMPHSTRALYSSDRMLRDARTWLQGELALALRRRMPVANTTYHSEHPRRPSFHLAVAHLIGLLERCLLASHDFSVLSPVEAQRSLIGLAIGEAKEAMIPLPSHPPAASLRRSVRRTL